MIKGYIIQDIDSDYGPVYLHKWTNRVPGDITTSAGLMYWDLESGPLGAYWFSRLKKAKKILKEVIALERNVDKVYVIREVYTFKMPVENRLGWELPMPKQL